MPEFFEALKEKIMVLDGAMGTLLYSMGAPKGHCYDELNLSDPELIKSVHGGYILAGADIITTNTFGANRNILDSYYDLGAKTWDINFRGARIAREAVKKAAGAKRVFIGGSIGPVTRPMEEQPHLDEDEARALFIEQAEALVDGGVDIFILETFADTRELMIAYEAIRSIDNAIPIIPMMTFTSDIRTIFGIAPMDAAETLKRFNTDIAGVNCSIGPQVAGEALKEMARAYPNYLAIAPNAGRASFVDGSFIYPATPEYFYNFAKRSISMGASIIGGCCGTTFEHIEAISNATEGVLPKPRKLPKEKYISPSKIIKLGEYRKNILHKSLEKTKLTFTAEIDPPRNANPNSAIEAAKYLKKIGFDTVSVADLPLARLRMSAMPLSRILIDDVGLDVILHFTARDRNIIALQSDLLGAHAMGIKNILALRGDPPAVGDYPFATGVYDVNSRGLVAILSKMNRGLDRLGNQFKNSTNFTVGVAANHELRSIKREIERLEQKIEAGAHFIQTQPVFDSENFKHFTYELKKRGLLKDVHIVASILPLYSYRNAEFLHNEVPGISIPMSYQLRMKSADNPRNEGAKIASEILNEIRDDIAGVCFMPPFGKYKVIEKILDKL
ncbi:MAG: bifunctional homocysteine S-methyltransferase/methylenetetrahydrofolate reductase [Candidatus Zixiibacteriota bacterium]